MDRISKKTKRPNRKKVEPKKSSSIRLNKYLAQSGVTSRRKADECIQEGLVKINGKTVFEMGVKVDPKVDKVSFKGKPIRPVENYTYLIVYKPRQVLTSLSDPLDRPTVKDLIPKKFKKENLFPVGRLDWNSEGLLILTNDGDYAQNILHPKKKVPKTYEVKVEGEVQAKDMEKLVKGVSIEGGKARAIKVEASKKSKIGSHTWLKITVVEGRNRLIRKMLERLGYSVMRLRRISIGRLKVGALKAGDCFILGEDQRKLVFKVPPYLQDHL